MGQARGQVDFGLINVYRGLGGGWQIRLQCPPNGSGVRPDGAALDSPVQPEIVPSPAPEFCRLPEMAIGAAG